MGIYFYRTNRVGTEPTTQSNTSGLNRLPTSSGSTIGNKEINQNEKKNP